jgi:glutathione synthase
MPGGLENRVHFGKAATGFRKKKRDKTKTDGSMNPIVALQMDPIETVNIATDSSFALGLEAQKRGAALIYYNPRQLFFRDGMVGATVRPLTLRPVQGDHFSVGAPEIFDLAQADVVLLRQDPPFDMAYITTTHLLEKLKGKALVVNDPASVRNAPEKLLVTDFPDLMPPTLIASDRAVIRAFRDEHKDIVIKPLYGNGGAGVFHLKPDDGNFSSLLETYATFYREPLVVQRYVPAATAGDKRIILADGEIAGYFLRVPAAGEARSNLHIGGSAAPCDLTKRDREICERIGPELKKRDLIFVGIDVIGDYLTEINVTSPTGLWEAQKLCGSDGAAMIWDAIEKRM